MSLDARTLLILGGFGSWILVAAIEFQAVRTNRDRWLPDMWTLGLLAQGMGLILAAQRGEIGDFWSIPVANSLLMSTPLFGYVALQVVRGAKSNLLLIATVPVGVGVLLPVVGFSDEAFHLRAIVVLCAALFGLSLMLWSAAQIARAGYVAGASLILGSGVALVATFIAFVTSVVQQDVHSVLSGPGIQLAFYAVNDACIVLGTLGYMDITRIARKDLAQIDDPMLPDRLTGLYSHHAFMRSGLDELQRARRRHYPVCAMVLMIDGHDRLREVRGQAFADAALRRVAEIIQKDIRTYDIAARAPRGMIAVMLPELLLAKGVEAANRIRARVAAELSNAEGLQGARISAGVCEAGDAQEDLDALMAKAETCLRRAQLDGGDRVATPAGPAAQAPMK